MIVLRIPTEASIVVGSKDTMSEESLIKKRDITQCQEPISQAKPGIMRKLRCKVETTKGLPRIGLFKLKKSSSKAMHDTLFKHNVAFTINLSNKEMLNQNSAIDILVLGLRGNNPP